MVANCMLFVKIHKINGTVTLADAMFDLRSSVRMVISMAQAGNWSGVDTHINQCESLVQAIKTHSKHAKVDTAKQDVANKVEILWNELKPIVLSHDKKAIQQGIKTFLTQYNEIYFQVL